MVRYSKDYGDIFDNVFTWGVEIALSFLFRSSERNQYKLDKKYSFSKHVFRASKGKVTKRQASTMFYRLKKEGYLEIGENRNETSVKLTDKAKLRIVEEVVRKISSVKKNRFISFDIPERLHGNRDRFRAVIKRMGFRQIQQSLWVISKDIGEMVEIAAKEHGVEDYVAYMICESSNIDKYISSLASNSKINEHK